VLAATVGAHTYMSKSSTGLQRDWGAYDLHFTSHFASNAYT
jgi:hypothetical protein